MTSMLYVVRYTGPFGFIKPWTAVRDGETFSQAFLTPSIVEGMRQKLGVSAIVRNRLAHEGLNAQQERVQSPGWASTNITGGKALVRKTGILTRHVMLSPTLNLAFVSAQEAEMAAFDHLCLCRNEDLVFPIEVGGALVRATTADEFDALPGFEIRQGDGPDAIPLGVNRFTGEVMRGRVVVGRRREEDEA